MDQKEEKGSSGPKPRYVWDSKKLAWVEITEPEIQESLAEKAAVEPMPEEVSEDVKEETRAEEVSGEAQVEGAPAEAVAEAGGLQYRGALIRLMAFIVDAIVLFVILYLFDRVSGSQVLVNATSGKTSNSLTWHQWVFIGILLVYFVGFWVWRGQTPGKMLARVKIVKNDGGKIGIVRALLRFLVFFLYLLLVGFAGSRLIILFVIILFAIIIIALNKRKRGIHDFIAGTVVVDSRAPALQPVEAEAVEDVEVDEATETAEPPVTSKPETDKPDQEK